MKKSVVLFSALAALGGFVAVHAQETPKPAASSQAEQDYQAYQELAKRMPSKPVADMSTREKMEFSENLAQDRRTLALRFIESYPADPRRWNVVAGLTPTSPRFIKEFGPDDAKGSPTLVFDEPVATAWKAKVAALKDAMAKAPDLPLEVQEQQAWGEFAAAFRATTTAKNKKEAFDYGPFHARFDAHVAKYASLPNLPARARDYLGALESSMPGAGVTEWKYLLNSPNETMRKTAQEQLVKLDKDAARQVEMKAKPLELAFTAVDGRAVDLKNLRGKVVLIDFWATWCGPCIAELPNVKNVYAAYHDKGFEIIGISLENGALLPADTVEQTATKMTKAAKVLTDFTAKNEVPWPQQFDGKYWKNEVSTRFEINAIPAMFLLDQEGKVVSTNARGPKLEEEVKRLLKL